MMNNFQLEMVDLNNTAALQEVKDFLTKFSLKMDDVDHTVVIKDENHQIIATCSKLFNLIKCVGVDKEYRGYELANKLVTYYLNIINDEYDEAFIITKPEYNGLFQSMGFGSLFENDQIAFLTSRMDKVRDYQAYLSREVKAGINGVIVMNANPFTNGHLALVETAAKQVDNLYLIPVLENLSFFTYQERKVMIEQGVQDLVNVKVLNGCPYIISKSVFPSYFLKSSEAVIQAQTQLDANLFVKLFKDPLKVKKRFLGSEPISHTTDVYNQTLTTILEKNNIEVVIIPRVEFNHQPISASEVRASLVKGDWNLIEKITPLTTVQFLKELDLTPRLKANLDKIYKDN